MRLQSALSMNQFAGLDDFGRSIDDEEHEARRRRRKRKRRRAQREMQHRRAQRMRRRAQDLDPQPRRQKKPRRAEPTLVRASRRPVRDEALKPMVIDAEYIEESAVQGVHPWSPAVTMGPNLRIQAATGYRAAVIELKPGLFVVAEVPEHITRSEFGVLPLLAPLVVKAAAKAISTPPEQRLLPKLVQAVRQQPQAAATAPAQPGVVQRLLTARQPTPAPAAPQRQLVPVAGSGQGHSALLPAPVIGRWVDEDDLSGLFGCDQCGGRCRR